ncbi:MAG: serine/threonine-protein kinase [Myxococcota bacterium]
MAADTSIGDTEHTQVLLTDAIDPPPVAPGTVIGRYVVDELIGTGGMGRVYRAHDPRLDRTVALKLVRYRGSTIDLDRMRREAMAMAQLSHPNVLPIYDVDRWQGLPFFVMELVHGRTLRDWAQDRGRHWRTLLPMFIEAGRGLAAAHAAGLVHRDFKPTNVLVGDDGRVRVMDFGLARAQGSGEIPSEALSETSASLVQSYNQELTAADTVMGTPAYMPPEQLCADPVGPAADQYAFCVSLWEVATGERPFAHSKTLTHAALLERTQPPPDPPAAPWPPALRHVLHRGLRPRPEDRFASMEDLLDALERTGRPSRGLAVMAGVGLFGLVTAAAVTMVATSALDSVGRPDPCPSPEQLAAQLWDPEHEARTNQALLATGAPQAAATWERLWPTLATYRDDWARARSMACHRIGEADETPQIDAQIQCLDQRRRALNALVTALDRADGPMVHRAVELATELPLLSTCDDPEQLATLAPPPTPGQAPAVESARERLAQLRTRHEAGDHRSTVEPARALLDEALAIGYAPLTIDARLTLGRALARESSPEATEPLDKAYFDANLAGLESQAGDAAILMAQALGVGLGRHAQALQWSEHARAAAQRTGDPLLRIRYFVVLGNVYSQAENFAAARDARQRALELVRPLHGVKSIRTARAEMALASPLTSLGQYEQAQQFLEHAQEILEHTLGPQHPHVASVYGRLGHMNRLRGALDLAEEQLERALAIHESVQGSSSLDAAGARLNLGIVAFHRHDFDTAEAHFLRCLEIQQARLGPRHHRISGTLLDLAVIDRMRGRYQQGIERLEHAREITEEHFGPSHRVVWMAVANMGNLYGDQGKLDRAAALYTEARELAETHHGTDSAMFGSSLLHLGALQSRQDLHAEAEVTLARAAEILAQAKEAEPDTVGHALAAQARAYQRAGKPERALAPIRSALAIYEEIYDPEHPITTSARGLEGVILLETGRPDDALDRLEPAYATLKGRERNDVSSDRQATLAFGLARALWSRPAERPRAQRLARSALALLRAAPGDHSELHDALTRWLDEHAP